MALATSTNAFWPGLNTEGRKWVWGAADWIRCSKQRGWPCLRAPVGNRTTSRHHASYRGDWASPSMCAHAAPIHPGSANPEPLGWGQVPYQDWTTNTTEQIRNTPISISRKFRTSDLEEYRWFSRSRTSRVVGDLRCEALTSPNLGTWGTRVLDNKDQGFGEDGILRQHGSRYFHFA